MDAKEICELWSTLESERAEIKNRWEKVVDLFMTGHGGVYGETTMQQLDVKQLDRTGADALRDYAAGMFSNTINPSRPWFTLRVSSPEFRDNKTAQDEICKRGKDLHRVLQNSNLEMVLPIAFTHHGGFGTGIVYQDVVDGKFRFQSYTPVDCNICENEHGIIDTLVRKFKYTNKQAYGRWGDDCPESVCKAMKSNDPKKAMESKTYYHCVSPRTDAVMGAIDKKNKPFASYYVCADTKDIVEEGGYDLFPYYVFRGYRFDSCVWGQSPAMTHVDTQLMLCKVAADMAQFAESGIRPPMFFDDEETVRNNNISLAPSSINYYRSTNGKPPVLAYPAQGVYEPTLRFYSQYVKVIRDAFFADLFLQETEAPDMTATEVLERKNERLSRIAPIAAQTETELYRALVERSFYLAVENKMIDEMPEQFKGSDFEIHYTSRLSSMLSRNEIQSSLQAFMEAASVAEGIANLPLLAENIDGDKFIQEIFEANNVDPDLTRSEKAIADIRAAKAEAEERMRQEEIQSRSVKPIDPNQSVQEGSLVKEMQEAQGA